jgi:hypothetical protein
MDDALNSPSQRGPAASASPRPSAPQGGFNWVRFWLRSLLAMLVFNLVAGFATWYWIFPRLHPAH